MLLKTEMKKEIILVKQQMLMKKVSETLFYLKQTEEQKKILPHKKNVL